MNDTGSLLFTLRGIVGDAHVLSEGDLSAYEKDWTGHERGRALAVVRPATAGQAAAVVRACAGHGTAIVPQGGNTGLVAGSIPDTSGTQVVLQTGRMNAIRGFDRDNLTVTVEAGCILQTLQEAARREGLLFALSLAAEGSCTIGGNLATNAGGTQVVRYGNARELCLGLEVVTAQGEVWSGLKGLRKDNTGYDLRDLFIGSEGTLGLITAATMKLHPLPAARLTAWARVASLRAAVDLLGLAHRHLGAALTGFEVMNRCALSLVQAHLPQLRVPLIDDGDGASHAVLLESSGTEPPAQARASFDALLEAALAQGCVADAVVAHSESQSRSLWQVRESIALAESAAGGDIGHDVSLPISSIPAFVDHAQRVLAAHFPGAWIANYGHLGDGNLHFDVGAPPGADARAFVRQHAGPVNRLVYDAVAQFGGSFSAEHGIGHQKPGHLARYQSPVALAMMRSIKQALDPSGTFNPGCILPPG